MDYFIIYLITINLLAIILMKIDKANARKRKQRISEKTLFLIGFLYGSVGILLGMYLFRHKTKKIKFKLLVPMFFLAQFLIFYYYIL